MSNQITAIVLAAGMGRRMRSQKPKVLHAAAGRPLIDHVLGALSGAGVQQVRLVVGHGGDQVKQHLWGRPGVEFFSQAKQLGTADAVKAAQPSSLYGTVMICNGDHPLISSADYRWALDRFQETAADLLVISARTTKPEGFGRILRDEKQNLIGVIEEKDADSEQKMINEVNSGLFVVRSEILNEFLPQIKNHNAQKEFYLPDLIPLALAAKKNVVAASTTATRVIRGVNTVTELALATRALYRRKNLELMQEGVVIHDPSHTYIDSDVTIQPETVIGVGCVIAAGSVIGWGCLIEPYCHIRASKIAPRVEIRWGTLIDQSEIEEGAVIGPYARLRPETIVEREAHVGNFVELKKTRLGARAKANHLTYLGDAEIGEETNIGCGTITCNYAVDRKKYKTRIGKNVFVGSDSQFVAPVNVGDGAVIASGSTVTEDVPAKALAIARSRQINKNNFNKES